MRKTKNEVEAAAKAICAQCDEIIVRSEDSAAALSECFALARTIRISEACVSFILAIAQGKSGTEIQDARRTLSKMRDRVLLANRRIAARLGDEQDILTALTSCEETLFKLMDAGDPTVRILAKLAASHTALIRIVLTAALSSIRKHLESIERRGEVKVRAFSFKAIQQLLAAVRGRPADRTEALVFMRSLYDTDEAQFNSCHKVVEFVQTCKNANDPYFNQCSRIRALVKSCAKKERGGEERVWRSLAQELKPSHAKCHKHKPLSARKG